MEDITTLPTISSLNPRYWGKPTWEFLDMIVATYPLENPTEDRKNAVFELMDSLLILLPCPKCRLHYKEFRKHHSLTDALQSRATFIEFYYQFQKDVADNGNHHLPFHNSHDMWKQILSRFKKA